MATWSQSSGTTRVTSISPLERTTAASTMTAWKSLIITARYEQRCLDAFIYIYFDIQILVASILFEKMLFIDECNSTVLYFMELLRFFRTRYTFTLTPAFTSILSGLVPQLVFATTATSSSLCLAQP